jgi:hypothetical protein
LKALFPGNRIIACCTSDSRLRSFTIIILFHFAIACSAQIGGRQSFEFLSVPPAARLAALGGVNVSLADRDVNFLYANPALVGDTLAGFGSVNYQFYPGKIGHAAFTYAGDFRKMGVVSFGVQHMTYGTIQGFDANGNETGTFKAGETALVVSKTHTVRNFRMGASLKGVFSNLAGYRASALVLDLGGLFIHPDQNFTAALTIKNLGVVISEYSETSNTKVPFDVQAGVSFKPRHMPLRFSVTAFNLNTGDVTYYNAGQKEEKPGAISKLLSHANFGAEILLHRNVNILIGYNYLVHQSLKLSSGGGGAGLNFGFSARVKTAEFIFSRSGYVAGSAGYSFTVSTNVNKILTKR